MKILDLNENAQKALAGLMLRSLGELNGRTLQQATGLETLAVVAMRILVASEQIALQPLISEAINQVSDENLPVSLASVREGLTVMFDGSEHLTRAGITFHTLQ